MSNETITWPGIERITLGVPAAEAVAAESARLGARRVFLLVSQSLDTQTDEIEKLRRALGARYAGSTSGIRAHGPKSDIVTAAARARDARADLIVAVGGGTINDAGKILLICLKHDITTPEQLDPFVVRFGADGVTLPAEYAAPDIRAISVPTTLSGAELNALSGALDEKLKRKQGFEHRGLVPATIVLDPALTRHTPDWLWNSTGIRAVDHAVETLASTRSNAFFDGIADSALRLLASGLVAARENPEDLAARLDCQIGAAQAAMPLVGGVPMGASHAIGHLLGAVAGVPHGYTSCVMSPFVQAWNAEVDASRQGRISACLGRADAPAADLLDELIRALGMPRTLPDVGVTREQFPAIASGTLQDIWGRTNPRPIATADDVTTLLERAWLPYARTSA